MGRSLHESGEGSYDAWTLFWPIDELVNVACLIGTRGAEELHGSEASARATPVLRICFSLL